MKPKLYIDYDETLVNFVEPWINWSNFKYQTDLSLDDIKTYNFFIETFGLESKEFYYLGECYDKDLCKPFKNSKEFIKEISKDFDIVIISYCSKMNENSKREHAKKHFGIENFINAKEKWRYTKDGVLIDDNPHNIFEHNEHNNQISILFNFENKRPYANGNKNIAFDYQMCEIYLKNLLK